MTMSKRAVLYARVSTDEQAKGYSLQTQLDASSQYAVARGYSVVEKFQDDYTGASLDRPGLNALRAYVSADSVNVVIVYDVDRLARKSIYQMLIEEELRRAGAVVEYVTGQYADNDEGRLQKQIRGAIAEYEKAKIIERSKRGKRGKAQSGFVVAGARPPYGYRVRTEPHKAWLEVDEEEAVIVRMVYQWYLRGDGQSEPMSINAIATRLTAMHIPTRGDNAPHVAKKRGRGVWSSGIVQRILSNETYTGAWHFGKTRMMSEEELRAAGDTARAARLRARPQTSKRKNVSKVSLSKDQAPRPREEWIPVAVPAIVSREEFELAGERRQINAATSRRNRKRDYLLSGRLRCGKCGYSYVGRTRRETNLYYYCKGREQKPVSLCDMPNIRGDWVEAIVWHWLKDVMQHPDQLAKGLRAEKTEAEQKLAALRARLSLITDKLAEAEAGQEELLGMYVARKFKPALLDRQKAELDKTIADLTQEKRQLLEIIEAAALTEEQIAAIETEVADIRDGLDHATRDDMRRYFDLLRVRGTIAVENDERIIYASCRFGKQRLSLAPTSPSSNTGAIAITRCVCLPIPRSR
jgi:site-specific DNA recombinase